MTKKLEKTGVQLIAEERATHEGRDYDADHDDDNHGQGDLALVAALYATPIRLYRMTRHPSNVIFEDPFPWDYEYDARQYKKNRDGDLDGDTLEDPSKVETPRRIRQLVKAGALIAAEIDRLQRRVP